MGDIFDQLAAQKKGDIFDTLTAKAAKNPIAPSPQGMANQAMAALGQKIQVGAQPRPQLNDQSVVGPGETALGPVAAGISEVAGNTASALPTMLGNAFDPGGVQEGKMSLPPNPGEQIIHNPLSAIGIDKPRLERASKEGDIGDVLTQTGNAVLPQWLLGKLGAKAGLGEGMGQGLKDSATAQMGRVLSPTTNANKFLTQKVAPGLVDRGFMAATRGGAEAKAAAAKEAAGQALDEAWSKIPDDSSMQTKPILDALENSKEAFKAGGVAVEPEAINRIQSLQDVISQYGDNVSPQTLRKVRQIWDASVSQGGGYYGKTLAEGGMLDAKREAANAIRNELANQYPDIQKVNGEFSFWSNVDKVLQDTKQRKMGQATPMGEKIAGAAGAAVGATHGLTGVGIGLVAARALQKAFRSTAWQTVSAATKNSIADGIANGNLGPAAMLAARATATNADAGNP